MRIRGVTTVTRKLYPVLYPDRAIEDIQNDIWTMFDAFRGPSLMSGNFADCMLLGGFTEFKVDVNDNGEEVMVVADLPGVEKQDITIWLLNPRSLEISTERKNVTNKRKKGTMPGTDV
jgi:HSP20 family protein